MLIRIYGEFWNPDVVDWGRRGPGNRGTLPGKIKTRSGRTREVDFWDVRGVYALYDDFKLVYAGQVFDRALGARLRNHLTDRFAGRWDMFSWYGTSSLRETTVRVPGARQVEPSEVINTLEALAIALTDPPLNRRHNQIPGARLVQQVKSPHPHTIRHYLEEILKKL